MTKRILVVDDEVDFSELLQFRLTILNYEVAVAFSGTEALNKARSFTPDAILLDFLLPDLDGLALCEILRRLPSTRKTVIFLITAVSSETTRQAARDAGAQGFFGKPVDFALLQTRLENALAPKPPGEEETDFV